MTTRVVIHAGFHKTGTTTVQSTIDANRRLLSRQLRCYLKPDFERLTEVTRAFSVEPSVTWLGEVAEQAEAFFATLDIDDPRPVLMSSEDLSGHLPGRHGLDRYDASALVMSQLAEAARARFGDDVDLTFFFSTRAREPWLRSTYWQNLRSTRLTLDFDSYCQQIAGAADLPAIVQEVAEVVAPAAVVSLALEQSKDQPLGPLTPILDILGVPEVTRAKMKTIPPENVQPDLGLSDVLLELNRSGFKDRYLREAKKLLRRLANRQVESD